MYTIVTGDVLKTSTDYIAHQVNTYGVMGSGIALDIKNKYPTVWIDFKRKCFENKPKDLIGTYQICKIPGDSKQIINCFTQIGTSHTDRQTDYEAVRVVFTTLESALPKNSIISVPYKYGCGLASGEWSRIEPIFKDIFENSDVTLQVVRRW